MKDFPVTPDLILIRLTASRAMLYAEAAGTSNWAASESTRAFGRPACAALPAALDRSLATLSLGCMGMRTFTEVADDRMLAAIPGRIVDDFVERLRTTLAANSDMRSYYEGHKASFA